MAPPADKQPSEKPGPCGGLLLMLALFLWEHRSPLIEGSSLSSERYLTNRRDIFTRVIKVCVCKQTCCGLSSSWLPLFFFIWNKCLLNGLNSSKPYNTSTRFLSEWTAVLLRNIPHRNTAKPHKGSYAFSSFRLIWYRITKLG